MGSAGIGFGGLGLRKPGRSALFKVLAQLLPLPFVFFVFQALRPLGAAQDRTQQPRIVAPHEFPALLLASGLAALAVGRRRRAL